MACIPLDVRGTQSRQTQGWPRHLIEADKYLQHLIPDILSANSLHWSLFESPVKKEKKKEKERLFYILVNFENGPQAL